MPRSRPEKKKGLPLAAGRSSGTLRNPFQKPRKAKEKKAMRKVALDLGQRKIVLAERNDSDGVALRTFNSAQSVRRYLSGNVQSAEVAFEACHQGWAWAKWLRKHGHAPIMVDTTRLAEIGIGRHGRKTDEIDAERLLGALERGQLPRAHIASEPSQALRVQLNIRAKLVQMRASMTTMIRQLVRAQGEKFDRQFDAIRMDVVVHEAKLSEPVMQLIEPLLGTVRALNAQLRLVERKLEALSAKEPVIAQLCTVPGVGPTVAATFVSVIDDPNRFERAHQVQSYLGLVPREHSSGGKQVLGSVSKAGNSYLRSLLVQSAWTIMHVKKDEPLKTWAEGIALRRGRMIAVVALARRLAGVLWAMWRSGTVYEAARLAAESYRGLRSQAQSAEHRAKMMAQVRLKQSKQRSAWNRLLEVA